MHKYILIINALQRRLESIEVQVHISSSPLKSLADTSTGHFSLFQADVGRGLEAGGQTVREARRLREARRRGG